MKLIPSALFFLLVIPFSVAAQSDTSELVDLSHDFGESTIYWPTEAGFQLTHRRAGLTERGYFYAANRFDSAEHGGTHLDAPRHFWEGGQTVDQIPLSQLIGPAVCVDVSMQCQVDRDYQVSVEDLLNWESRENESLAEKIVLLRTGFGRHWPDREKYLGTLATGPAAVAQLHFPGLHPSAADWLITRRRVRLVGIDTASIDHGQSTEYPTHIRLFRDGVPALENVANLDRLSAKGFTVAALPMKIAGGSGAPCRIVATILRPDADR